MGEIHQRYIYVRSVRWQRQAEWRRTGNTFAVKSGQRRPDEDMLREEDTVTKIAGYVRVRILMNRCLFRIFGINIFKLRPVCWTDYYALLRSILRLAFTASVDKTILLSWVSPSHKDRGRKVVHAVATCNCGGGRSPLYLIGTAG